MSPPPGRLSRLFQIAWCAAWCRRHSANGVKVDSLGNLTVPGNLALAGNLSLSGDVGTGITLTNAFLTLTHGNLSLTDGGLTLTNGGFTMTIQFKDFRIKMLPEATK